MDALRALADTNLKVSEARNTLSKLQQEETEYLISREKKAVGRIIKILADSHSLVEETNKNYELISDFCQSVTESSKFLSQALEAFQALSKEKEAFYETWERDIKNQEDTIVSLRNGLKVEGSAVKGMIGQLETERKKIVDDTRKVADERGKVARAIERLKNNRI